MIAEVSTQEFREKAGELLAEVQANHADVLIRENGEAIAVLVDARSYARFRELNCKGFDELQQRMSAAYANVPEEEGLAEIERICREVRGKCQVF